MEETRKARKDAEECRQRISSEARNQAKAVLDKARADGAQEAEAEIAKAMVSIEKIREAAQAELETQRMYTKAARIKAVAPSKEDCPMKDRSVSQPKARNRSKASK
jgi:F0F1-type ATP synthase membrane subunit b/b'